MKDLLLLHGALGVPEHFIPCKSWLERHFKVHTLTFAGHGASPVPPGGIAIEHYIEQVREYCSANRLEEVYIFGYSMGGYVGLSLALQHPGLVASVLTLATKLSWDEETALRESKKLNPGIIKEKVPQFATQLAQIHGPDKWEQLLPAVAGMMQQLGAQPLLDAARLASLSIPVQLMVGDKDNMVTLEETFTAAAAIPGARLAVLPATRHPLESVRPQLLTDLIKDFWELPA